LIQGHKHTHTRTRTCARTHIQKYTGRQRSLNVAMPGCVHCNTLQHIYAPDTATHCNTTIYICIHKYTVRKRISNSAMPGHTHCNTLQHICTHYTATHRNIITYTCIYKYTDCNTLQHNYICIYKCAVRKRSSNSAMPGYIHCNTLQHKCTDYTATHYNTIIYTYINTQSENETQIPRCRVTLIVRGSHL